MIGSKDPEYAVSEQMAQNAAIEMYMYSNELAKQRREDPRDDIVTALLKSDANGDSLSEMDFNVFFLLLAVAGNETTRNALSHGVHALIDHPGEYRKLVANPSLMSSATEEVLRTGHRLSLALLVLSQTEHAARLRLSARSSPVTRLRRSSNRRRRSTGGEATSSSF